MGVVGRRSDLDGGEGAENSPAREEQGVEMAAGRGRGKERESRVRVRVWGEGDSEKRGRHWREGRELEKGRMRIFGILLIILKNSGGKRTSERDDSKF